ncbi:hypothetical protein GCM10010924_12170 [Rhizobium wenxiniae]|uniref:Uncharacterized protein n=1 Tax=Rhizobium wenxiniae TaxID=1737357 RepID=A0A7X0CY99_9HYPH|nr:hypothetical protein [Rhizobium wenxiniae]MBB6161065.1 hypothetical protein [Rhizobium wenxiniae]GGF86078.1 hypothetical protein GCM10010924_12170 [Rhizobium wenxiniae]
MEKLTFPRTLFFVGGSLTQRNLIASAATGVGGLTTRLRPEEWSSDAARRYLDAHHLAVVNEIEGHELSSALADVISRDADIFDNNGMPVKTLDIECLITGSTLPLIDPAIAAEIASYIVVVSLDKHPVKTMADARALIEKAHGSWPGWTVEGGKRSSPLAITPAAEAWVENCSSAVSGI